MELKPIKTEVDYREALKMEVYFWIKMSMRVILVNSLVGLLMAIYNSCTRRA
jgi:type III secretory pathway component EscS